LASPGWLVGWSLRVQPDPFLHAKNVQCHRWVGMINDCPYQCCGENCSVSSLFTSGIGEKNGCNLKTLGKNSEKSIEFLFKIENREKFRLGVRNSSPLWELEENSS